MLQARRALPSKAADETPPTSGCSVAFRFRAFGRELAYCIRPLRLFSACPRWRLTALLRRKHQPAFATRGERVHWCHFLNFLVSNVQ